MPSEQFSLKTNQNQKVESRSPILFRQSLGLLPELWRQGGSYGSLRQLIRRSPNETAVGFLPQSRRYWKGPQDGAREVSMGGGGEKASMQRERRMGRLSSECLDYIEKSLWGRGSQGRGHSMPGMYWGMLGEHRGQVHFGMLNRHLSPLSWVWNPTNTCIH